MFLSDEQDLSAYVQHSYAPRELTAELTSTYHNNLDITDPTEVADFLTSHPANDTYYSLLNNEIILTDAGINQALAYDNEVYNNANFSDKTEAYYLDVKLKVYDFLIGATLWNKAEGPGAQYNDQMFMGFDQGQSWRPAHKYFFVKYDKNINSKLNFSNFLRYKVHDFDKDNSIVRYRRNYTTPNRYTLQHLLAGFVPTYDSLYLFQKSNQLREELKLLYQPIDRIDVVAGIEFRFSSIQGDYTGSSKNNAEQNGAPLTNIDGGNQFFSQDFGAYAQTGISLIENLKMTLGLRYDYNKVREDEGYGHVFNPRLTLVYSPKGFIFKAIYAEAFKDATNREKYSTAAGKRELTNPTLQPEKVKNYEFSVGKDFNESLMITAAAYYSEYSNIIQEVAVQRDDGTFTNQNQAKGKAKIIGVNAMADYKWGNLTCYANYTYTLPFAIDPTDSNGNPMLDADSIPYKELRISDIADHQINIGANYLFRDVLNANLRVNIMSERKTGLETTVPTNPDKFDPYFILNGALNYSPKNLGLTIQLSIFNILNTEYYSPGLDQATAELASSLKQNGRNMYLSLIYEF
ncbi:MAG: TonB-dependent receptor, partial [Bacteroidales bacterium]|nr:TonB-dependent receptor [Bacteroidales bacterium]